MTRTADHDARRHQMSQAAIQIALARGISRVTVAQVAAEAGVSVGLVQHYFSSKHALMTRVYDDLLARVDERIADVVDAGEASGQTIREMAVDALAELLPLDEGRAAECLVRTELETLATRDDQLRQVALGHGRQLRARLATVVANAKACGEAPGETDPQAVADALWAAVSGATQTRLLDADFDARAVVARAAQQAFPHPCRRHL